MHVLKKRCSAPDFSRHSVLPEMKSDTPCCSNSEEEKNQKRKRHFDVRNEFGIRIWAMVQHGNDISES